MVMSTPEAGADWPEVSMLLRMFSTEVAVRAEQPSQALVKLFMGVPVQESKKLAGKSVRLEQKRQARLKLVPAAVLISGKLVRLEQPRQALLKLVPALVSSNGKLVRLEQLIQALVKSVPAAVLISGKLVRLLQPPQARLKSVPAAVLISGKLVRLEHPFQALSKLVPAAVLSSGKLVRLEQFCQARLKSVPPVASTVASNASRLLQPENARNALNFILSGAGPSAATLVSWLALSLMAGLKYVPLSSLNPMS